MKRVAALILCLTFILGADYSFASGKGPQFSYERGGEGNVSVNHFVFGYLSDNCAKRDQLYGHRFSIGFDLAMLDVAGSGSANGYGLNIKHTWAFGVVRTSAFRVWIGPAVKFYTNYYTEGDGLVMTGVGAGPEVGVNIHLGDSVSLAISGGYHFTYMMAYDLGASNFGHDPEHMFSVTVAPIFLSGEDKDSW